MRNSPSRISRRFSPLGLLLLSALIPAGCGEAEPPRPYTAPEDAEIELREEIVFLNASELARRTSRALETADMKYFAPVHSSPQERRELLENLEQVIRELEKELSR